MTTKLQTLVDAWDDETVLFNLVSKRYLASVSSLSELNKLIYNECLAQGIDIKDLKLNNKDERT